MSSFRFRLQKLLELRRYVEREKALELALAQREAQRARDALERLRSVRERGRDRVARAQAAGELAGRLQSLSGVVDRLARAIREGAAVCEAEERDVATALERLNAASRDRRVMDRLRDRQHEAWCADEARAERKRMDEVASNRHQALAPASPEEEGP